MCRWNTQSKCPEETHQGEIQDTISKEDTPSTSSHTLIQNAITSLESPAYAPKPNLLMGKLEKKKKKKGNRYFGPDE